MSKKTSPNDIINASKEVMAMATARRAAKNAAKPAAKPVAAKPAKVSATENGELTPAKEPDLGESELGLAVPPELEQSIKEDENKEPQEDLGIVIPPGVELPATIEVVDPDLVDEEATLDMNLFADEDAASVDDLVAANTHWTVFANGEPLASIALKDQDHKEKIAAHFVSPAFANSVISATKKKGLKAALAEVRARFYVAKVDETKKVKEITARLTAKSEEATRQKLASVKASYTKSLALALQAAANNFTGSNVLKEDLVKRMMTAGIPSEVAAAMVDDSFFAKGAEGISAILDKAEQWSNTAHEAMVDIKAAVDSAGRLARPTMNFNSPAARNPNYNSQLAAQYAGNAVPTVSATVSTLAPVSASVDEGEELSRKDAYRAKFSKYNRR